MKQSILVFCFGNWLGRFDCQRLKLDERGIVRESVIRASVNCFANSFMRTRYSDMRGYFEPDFICREICFFAVHVPGGKTDF